MHASLGHKMIAIVELTSVTKTEKSDGTETVTLNILTGAFNLLAGLTPQTNHAS